MKYPDQSLESAKHFILVKISKKGSTFLKSLIPTSQIQMLVLLYVYSQLTAVFLWFIIPLIIFYICFLSLVVFSLQMFYGREALRQLRSVSELMKKYVICLLIFAYGNTPWKFGGVVQHVLWNSNPSQIKIFDFACRIVDLRTALFSRLIEKKRNSILDLTLLDLKF